MPGILESLWAAARFAPAEAETAGSIEYPHPVGRHKVARGVRVLAPRGAVNVADGAGRG